MAIHGALRTSSLGSSDPYANSFGAQVSVAQLELGVDPSEVVYVGDALIDGTAASRAGIEFWGVSTGETSAEALYDAGASKVFPSLTGVLDAALSSSK